MARTRRWPAPARVAALTILLAAALFLFRSLESLASLCWRPPTLARPAPEAVPVQPEAKPVVQVKPPLFWTSEELGVFHYRIPGEHNSSSSGLMYGVVMHIMIKVIQDDVNGMKIRGAAFCEQAEPPFYRHKVKDEVFNWHMSQPPELFKDWWPRMLLRALDGNEHVFVPNWFNLETPFGLTLELTQEQAQSMPSAQLMIDDWLAWYEVSPQRWAEHLKPGSLARQHRPPPLPAGHKRVVVVAAYFWGENAPHSAPYVVQSLRYHRRMGVHSFFVYALGGMMHSLTHHPEAVGAIKAGQLRVVDWEGHFPQYKGLRSLSDQPSMLTHAVLAHHNEDVLLLMVDLDEILVSFKPLLQRQLSQLMQAMLGNNSMIVLGRIDTMCSDCHGTREEPVVPAPGALAVEMALWVTSNLQNLSGHPLLHYRYLAVNDSGQMQPYGYGKSYCDPSKTLVYDVHWGKPMPGVPEVPKPCFPDCPGAFELEALVVPPLMLLHLIGLHGMRSAWRPWDKAHRVLRTEWQWPLQPLQA